MTISITISIFMIITFGKIDYHYDHDFNCF